jgi:hypothetical protein
MLRKILIKINKNQKIKYKVSDKLNKAIKIHFLLNLQKNLKLILRFTHHFLKIKIMNLDKTIINLN